MSEIFYISGKMTGIKDFNRPEFNKIEKRIKGKFPNAIVINPARHPDGLKYNTYMEYAIIDVENSHSLVMLNGWEESKGACIEYAKALELGKNILSENCFND